MRVLVLVKAEDRERGFVPTPKVKEMMAAMGKFNDELVNAGIMKPGDCDGSDAFLAGQACGVRWPRPQGD